MSRFRVLAAGLAVAAIAVLAVAAPASAHDELVASTPASGEALASAPSSVSLVFSADVMTIGAVIVIADADGVDWAASAPEFTLNTVSVAVRPEMPDAGYELRWRVVSSDGHPIAGIVPFTVGDGTPLVRDSVPGSASADRQGTRSSPQQSQAEQENGVARAVLVGAGGAGIAVALLVLVRYLIRRRHPVDGTGTRHP